MKLRCYPGPEVTGFALRDSRINDTDVTVVVVN